MVINFCMTHLRNGSCAANPQLNGRFATVTLRISKSHWFLPLKLRLTATVTPMLMTTIFPLCLLLPALQAMCTVSFSVSCSYRHTTRLRNTLSVPVCQRNMTQTFSSSNTRHSMGQSRVKRDFPSPRQPRCASSCTLTRAPQLLWVDLRVHLSNMFPASSPLHFTTTIIPPPMFPAALK